MSIIQLNNINFTYDGAVHPTFTNLNATLDGSWKLGLIGRNGRGKTTLLNILLGTLPYKGEIITPLTFKYFPYNISKVQEDDLALYVVESLEPLAEIWKVEKELSKLQTEPDILYKVYSTLSHGERTKLQLALLFATEDAFLLIDEPTNHLDRLGRKQVAAYLQEKAGFILVSHDRFLLDEVVDHIMALNKESIDINQGNYSTWKENKEREDAFALNKNEKLEGEISRLTGSMRETASWSDEIEKGRYASHTGEKVGDRGFVGARSARMMRQAKNIERRQEESLKERKGLLSDIEEMEPIYFHNKDHHNNQYVFLRNLSVYYDEGKPLFEEIYTEVTQGDRLFIKGANGSGKSSILKLLLGEDIPYTGSFTIENLDISYVPQDTSFLSGSLEAFAFKQGLDFTMLLTYLRKMGFSRKQFEKNMEDFSMGQKKKVLLAQSLAEEADLYIWDEPLNYIDIETREQIEDAILACNPTMIVIEHDQAFSAKVMTEEIELKKIE